MDGVFIFIFYGFNVYSDSFEIHKFVIMCSIIYFKR